MRAVNPQSKVVKSVGWATELSRVMDLRLSTREELTPMGLDAQIHTMMDSKSVSPTS